MRMWHEKLLMLLRVLACMAVWSYLWSQRLA